MKFRGRTLGGWTGCAGALALTLAVATGCTEPVSGGSRATTTTRPGTVDCAQAAAIVECAPRGSLLEGVLPKRPTVASGTPIALGTINQDTGVAGAFPELTKGYEVAIDFINHELGGVDGHPITLLTCDTAFSPQRSQSCAEQMVEARVAAVVGGIDVWGDGIKILENHRLPYVGGIPVSFIAARSPVSFQFSGGIWGTAAAEMIYAVETLGAKRVTIVYGEFPPIEDAARVGREIGVRLGATVESVTVPVIGADMVGALNQAASTKPDAVIALTADAGCIPTLKTAHQIGLEAHLLTTGACVSPNIVESVGSAADGVVFNLEADPDQDGADFRLYNAIADRYGPKFHFEKQSAGTISFRAIMNLYVQLRKIGAQAVSAETVLAAMRATRDEPSFMGHAYTCDGKEMPGLPAMCSPQQTLGESRGGAVRLLGNWIDIGAYARGEQPAK